MLVGMGVPSKYFTLPVSLSASAVGGDVEARQPADAADDEVGEAQHVPAAAQPEREAEHRRRHAERDHVGQRIEVGAEHRLPVRLQRARRSRRARRRRSASGSSRNAIHRKRGLPVAT